MSNKNQIHKILNEDTTQSYNTANKKLLNIIKNQVVNDSKSTNLFSQLHQKQNNEMLNIDLNKAKNKRTQLAIKEAELNPDGAVTTAVPNIPPQIASNFTIASQKLINIFNHIIGILRSFGDDDPPGGFNVNRDIKWTDLFDAFTQLQQQTIFILQGQGQFKSNQIVQQIDLVSSSYIRFGNTIDTYQARFVDENLRPNDPDELNWIIDGSIYHRLDIIDEFILNAQNQLQIFRDGLSQGGPFDDNTQGPIPPVYNYPIYQNAAVPLVAPQFGVPTLRPPPDRPGRPRRYDRGEEDDSDGYYSLNDDGDGIPSSEDDDDYSDDFDSDNEQLTPAKFGMTPTTESGRRYASDIAHPIAGKGRRGLDYYKSQGHPTYDSPSGIERLYGPLSANRSGMLRRGESLRLTRERSDGQRLGMLFDLQEQNDLLDRGEITGMQQSESQRQRPFYSQGDIISGTPSSIRGPFSSQPSGRYVSPTSPVPVRVIEKAADTQRRERLRFDRESVRELESHAPTTQKSFMSPKGQRSRGVSVRKDIEDMQARERDQLGPGHRLFDGDEVDLREDTAPKSRLTSAQRDALSLEQSLRDYNFHSVRDFINSPDVVDQRDQILNELEMLLKDDIEIFDEFREFMTKQVKQEDDGKDASLDRIAEGLVQQLRSQNFKYIYEYLTDPAIVSDSQRILHKLELLTEDEPDLIEYFREYVVKREASGKQSGKKSAKKEGKQSAKPAKTPAIDMRDLKGKLTTWHKSGNFEAFDNWKQVHISDEEEQSELIQTLALEPKNINGENYGILYADLLNRKSQKYTRRSSRISKGNG